MIGISKSTVDPTEIAETVPATETVAVAVAHYGIKTNRGSYCNLWLKKYPIPPLEITKFSIPPASVT